MSEIQVILCVAPRVFLDIAADIPTVYLSDPAIV